jgi:hypothetical protein
MDLVWRAGNILYQPRREWAAIAAERCTIPALYLGYVAIVAGLALVVEGAAGLLAGVPLGMAVDTALAGYALALADIALLAVVANFLAPRFGGVADLTQSFKLAGFGCTPAWLGSLFLLLPGIGRMLALAADFYGVYVYYTGIEATMQVPRGRRLLYLVTVLILTLALAAALALLFGELIGQARMTVIHG